MSTSISLAAFERDWMRSRSEFWAVLKNLTVVWLLLALGAGLMRQAHAQATIVFNNLTNSDASLDAPSNGLAFMQGTNGVCCGLLSQDVNFQLGAGPNFAALQLIHTWLLSDGSAKGISVGGGHFADPSNAVCSIPGVQPGAPAAIQIWAWPGNDDLGDAMAQGLPIGVVVFWNPTGGNGAAPMSLVGMRALALTVVHSGVTHPVLSISRAGNNVIVSWTNGPSYILQQTASLAPGQEWTDIGPANPSTPIAITNAPLFFRVRSP